MSAGAGTVVPGRNSMGAESAIATTALVICSRIGAGTQHQLEGDPLCIVNWDAIGYKRLGRLLEFAAKADPLLDVINTCQSVGGSPCR